MAMACSPATPAPMIENARRGHSPGGGGQHGENSGQSVGGNQHGFVAADRAHGGKRIHALGAGGSRHQFHRERGHAGLGNLLQDFRRTERPQEADQHLSATHQRQVGFPGDVVGSVAENLGHDVGRRRRRRHGPAGFSRPCRRRARPDIRLALRLRLRPPPEIRLSPDWEPPRERGPHAVRRDNSLWAHQ